MSEKFKDRDFFAPDFDDDDEDTQKDKYLTFKIGGQYYAVEIRFVSEIVILNTEITKVPDMENFYRGVINLRGRIIPVMDLRLRFGMEETAYDEKTCIVVVNIEEKLTGLVVERVSEVIDIPESEMVDAPVMGKQKGGEFVRSMGKTGESVKIVLDVEKLIEF